MARNYLQLNSSLAAADSLSSTLAARTVEMLAAVDRAAGGTPATTVRGAAAVADASRRLEQLAIA